MADRFPEKAPNEVLDYKFAWAKALSGETIAEHEIAIRPEGVVEDSSSIVDSSKSVLVQLSGGNPMRTYRITCQITTSAGRVFERSAFLPVKSR